MATAKIGGRDLDVKPATVGFWLRVQKVPESKAIVLESVRLIMEAVGHNDGVTLEWLQDNLAFPPTPEYRAVLSAAGLIDASASAEPDTGEARPQ